MESMPPPARPRSASASSVASTASAASAGTAPQVKGAIQTPAGPKKRKMACLLCRERRVRCDWPEDGGPCLTCQSTGTKPSVADRRMAKYPLNSALTFHLIEHVHRTAHPFIPGLPYDFFRNLQKDASGDRELEIAAEVFCGAFIATSSAFSDNELFIGKTDICEPEESPFRVSYNFDSYRGFGDKRREAVDTFALHARQLYEDSAMRLRPSIEAIYAALTMDNMDLYTAERGRPTREFVQTACEHWRTMLTRKREGLAEDKVALLQGPIALHLLLLDAQSAATLKATCTITDANLGTLVPHLSAASATPVLDPPALLDEETGWEELGKQLAPLTLSMAALYRAFTRLELSAFVSSATVPPFWTALDAAYSFLSTASHTVASLPPLPDCFDTAYRAFDLYSLLNHFRRVVLQLDLLTHQRIIDCMVNLQNPPAPKGKGAKKAAAIEAAQPQPVPPSLLQTYATSRQRIQRAFVIATELARHALDTSCVAHARSLLITLEVCSSWTSLRNSDQGMAAELVRELGITAEMGQSLLQLLSLVSWSMHSSTALHRGLKSGLAAVYGPLRPCPFPPPPALDTVIKDPHGRPWKKIGAGYGGIFGSAGKSARKKRRTDASLLGAPKPTFSISSLFPARKVEPPTPEQAEKNKAAWAFMNDFIDVEEWDKRATERQQELAEQDAKRKADRAVKAAKEAAKQTAQQDSAAPTPVPAAPRPVPQKQQKRNLPLGPASLQAAAAALRAKATGASKQRAGDVAPAPVLLAHQQSAAPSFAQPPAPPVYLHPTPAAPSSFQPPFPTASTAVQPPFGQHTQVLPHGLQPAPTFSPFPTHPLPSSAEYGPPPSISGFPNAQPLTLDPADPTLSLEPLDPQTLALLATLPPADDTTAHDGDVEMAMAEVPEDILDIHNALFPISPMFSIAAGFGNVHGVYKPGNVKLRP
ncbi:hypothetical protein JCM10207_004019, partial [Rhodosporidiobolus poonsookiae]